MSGEQYQLRNAKIGDVRAIHRILSQYAQRGLLLGRSLSDLYDQIRDFIVVVDQKEQTVAAVCSLHICWEELAEIRSLAVLDVYKGQGIGKKLVLDCIDEAKEFDIKKLFVLTYVPAFFQKLGFYHVDKSVLPHKVWADCIKCVKFPDCDEEAMMLDL